MKVNVPRIAMRYLAAQPIVVSPDSHLIDEVTGRYRWTLDRVQTAWATSMAELETQLASGKISKVVLMVGIPASGKTTWVANNGEPGVLYFDATFKDERARAPVINMARRYGVPVEATVMATPIQEAIRRNNTRTEDRKIPEDVILRQYRDLTGGGLPTRSEGIRYIKWVYPK